MSFQQAQPLDRLRFRALVEYDGTDYFGFQRQRIEQPTIQGELERVLTDLTRSPVTVTGAGRTDSGVHAMGQMISFTIAWQHGVDALRNALNANLPNDIGILKIEEAAPSFHPRYDARRRAYKYSIYNAAVRSPLRRRYSWYVQRQLDLDNMNQAAALLVGTRDFATFGTPPQGINTVREIYQAYFYRQQEFILFFVEANAFLYRMVRSLVGSLAAVGDGSWSVTDFADALYACDRRRSGSAAPPQGLSLVSVVYEERETE
ncbi:MAG: tRNA pseudouridine(38-40) synthase TruA [Anaerolineales bacterium]|nr:tRNA pseudouridine(38-40) synthase TruA [Anaerolineales bacterium]